MQTEIIVIMRNVNVIITRIVIAVVTLNVKHHFSHIHIFKTIFFSLSYTHTHTHIYIYIYIYIYLCVFLIYHFSHDRQYLTLQSHPPYCSIHIACSLSFIHFYSFIHLFIYSFIHSSIHPSIHPHLHTPSTSPLVCVRWLSLLSHASLCLAADRDGLVALFDSMHSVVSSHTPCGCSAAQRAKASSLNFICLLACL